jgi:hypothetical protein
MNQPFQTLQLVYAASLIDSLSTYTARGITQEIEQDKRALQRAKAKQTIPMLGIQTNEDVFHRLSDLFGCARWNTVPTDDGLLVTTSSCMLCALAKRQGTDAPCNLYCIDPIEGLLHTLNDTTTLTVEDTLWTGSECRFRVT